ncbi:hypothetical protein F9C07_4631 [Aspergillus flavus]|uniref:Uncharacterized protein n=1 Tax=Aspergillus flavus (strain ATCC 200026 / FGSC A1120 / IAM 13836 / NRRL 3357 / JCM 12722 / SRRC 167) TaxID=332952 RepID=A0A7U2QWP6_ASPFN|nr:hypothetical protein AFLA70_417g000890 [Aspergillus flavus AF70]QRD85600.1 hypothetical protein F9C07_4631 [Aspergillus flavus]
MKGPRPVAALLNSVSRQEGKAQFSNATTVRRAHNDKMEGSRHPDRQNDTAGGEQRTSIPVFLARQDASMVRVAESFSPLESN